MCKYTKIKELMQWTWQSSDIAENKPHAHHKTNLQTMKVSNTRPVGLTIKVLHIKIVLFFNHWSNHLFQSNQHFQVIEFMDQPVPEKFDIFRSFLFYAWLSLYPQFPWYLLRMPEDHNPILHTQTHTWHTKRNACNLRVSLLRQARL